jgi:hypothetical protein
VADPTNPVADRWSAGPTAKAKTAVQRSVTALLDALAPERVLSRVDQATGSIEQHRTPTGCVLQAGAAAVSVSWFAEATNDAALGELRVIVWRGRLARRGANRGEKGATVVAELVLRPIEASVDDCRWQSTDGTRYDTASLAAKCLTLLEEQLGTA